MLSVDPYLAVYRAFDEPFDDNISAHCRYQLTLSPGNFTFQLLMTPTSQSHQRYTANTNTLSIMLQVYSLARYVQPPHLIFNKLFLRVVSIFLGALINSCDENN